MACPLIHQGLVKGSVMGNYTESYEIIQHAWNDFSQSYGYPPHKLSAKDKNRIVKRITAQRDFISRLESYWPLIHSACDGYNLWGNPLTFKDFISCQNFVFAVGKIGRLP